MKNKKLIFIMILVLIIGVLVGGTIVTLSNRNKADDKTIDTTEERNEVTTEENNEKDSFGYSFEVTDKNVINKELQGEYLNSFITVALKQKEFTINLKGIDSNNEVFLINSDAGKMTELKYKDGIFSVKANLEKDITYGILIDYKLVGSIRVVEDLNTIDKDELFRDILAGMSCGL